MEGQGLVVSGTRGSPREDVSGVGGVGLLGGRGWAVYDMIRVGSILGRPRKSIKYIITGTKMRRSRTLLDSCFNARTSVGRNSAPVSVCMRKKSSLGLRRCFPVDARSRVVHQRISSIRASYSFIPSEGSGVQREEIRWISSGRPADMPSTALLERSASGS